ncbi:hypothetical protein D9M71_460920 [compost metagenome]
MPFDVHAEVLQTLDQQLFMLILGVDVQERVGGKAGANGTERQPRGVFALDPKVGRRHLVTLPDNSLGQVQLAVQLQGPCLYRQRPGGGAGGGGLVDDPHLDAKLAQPQRQHQPGGAGADNQDVTAVHRRRSSVRVAGSELKCKTPVWFCSPVVGA